jgi:hypothetical protein
MGIQVGLNAEYTTRTNTLLGFVMKLQKWDDDVTDSSFSCMFDTKMTYSSCIVRVMTKKDMQKLKTRLQEMSMFAWYPLFLPMLFIELRLKDMPETISRIRRFLVRVARITGTHKNYQQRLGLTKYKNGKVQDTWSEPDFEAAPAELTSIASDCIFYESKCRTRLHLLVWLESMHQALVAGDDTLAQETAVKMFAQKTQHMKAYVTEVNNRCAYFGKRAEIQLQMVPNTPKHMRLKTMEFAYEKSNSAIVSCPNEIML